MSTPIFRRAVNWQPDHSGMTTPATPSFAAFGERLAWWRKKRGFARQGVLSGKVGISQSSLSDLETGQSTSPSADTLLKLADALSLRPRYLLSGEGPPEAQYFQELSGTEAQLVMIFRQLPTDALREALLIDANDMLLRNQETPAQVYERLKTKPAARKPNRKAA